MTEVSQKWSRGIGSIKLGGGRSIPGVRTVAIDTIVIRFTFVWTTTAADTALSHPTHARSAAGKPRTRASAAAPSPSPLAVFTAASTAARADAHRSSGSCRK